MLTASLTASVNGHYIFRRQPVKNWCQEQNISSVARGPFAKKVINKCQNLTCDYTLKEVILVQSKFWTLVVLIDCEGFEIRRKETSAGRQSQLKMSAK